MGRHWQFLSDSGHIKSVIYCSAKKFVLDEFGIVRLQMMFLPIFLVFNWSLFFNLYVNVIPTV